MRRVVLFPFLFLAGVAVCLVFFLLVLGVRGGFYVFFGHCLLNVCVPRRQVPLQHAPPVGRSFLCPVPLSCCLSSVRSFGRLLVGARARFTCSCSVCM